MGRQDLAQDGAGLPGSEAPPHLPRNLDLYAPGVQESRDGVQVAPTPHPGDPPGHGGEVGITGRPSLGRGRGGGGQDGDAKHPRDEEGAIHAASSASCRIRSRAARGSSAAVTARPTTRRSEPASTASAGVATRL